MEEIKPGNHDATGVVVPAPRDYDLHKNISAALEKNPIINYEVQNDEIRSVMSIIGERINRALPQRWGFAVFIFDESDDKNPGLSAAVPGAESSCFYVSSHNRKSVLEMLKAWIKRQEQER